MIFSVKQDYIVSFGGYHSFIAAITARLRGVRCFIILNGTDSTAIPEFNYGHLRKGLLKYCCIKSYQWSTKLLPVSESLIYTINEYCFERKLLGLNAVKKNDWNYQVIPNGFDINFWKRTEKPDPKSIITVASSNRLTHKGVDLLFELAEKRPDFSIAIAGLDAINGCPPNVSFLGYLTAEQLRDAYSSSSYYFQLSIWEGFGCSLCEAMLCGCIPIVSDVNVLPEIVGSQNHVLKKKSISELDVLLNNLINANVDEKEFINRIKQLYSIDLRIEALINQLKL
ncbi:glycosyltransferase family 4 protein [Ekhidna sp.]|uniref:glycosyltransferase family 4 protein n=1 Tax=Ekhidna sp. TaxID=2608089 RepID=UPI0032988E89